MPSVAELHGLWQRSLIAWPDGRRDFTTEVRWLQADSAFADLRRPSPVQNFSHVACLEDLSQPDCLWLARQQGFAGRFRFDGRHFEWLRSIDFQPQGPCADAGTLRWEGEVLVEEGRDTEYIEHWHRDPRTAMQPSAAIFLEHSSTATQAILLHVGASFMYARGRTAPLPRGATLTDCLAGAATLNSARSLLDCEISYGSSASGVFQIVASTLPFRIGARLSVDEPWRITASEGTLDTLSAAGVPALRAL
jgi:hypothetical protein